VERNQYSRELAEISGCENVFCDGDTLKDVCF
jgi:hypothetical protein